jgi:hypothetical protein
LPRCDRYVITVATDDGARIAQSLAYLQSIGLSPRVEVVSDSRIVSKMSGMLTYDDVLAALGMTEIQLAKRWDAFVKLLGSGQKLTVLERILEAGDDGITSIEIAKEEGQEPNWFTGVFNGGVQRNIRKAGFEIEYVVDIRNTPSGRVYAPGPLLRTMGLRRD